MKSFSSPKVAVTYVLFAMMESKYLHIVAVFRQHVTISNVHFRARAWSESNVDGRWSTANIMKVVLAFIFCGNVHKDLEPLLLLSVAAEYDIPSLKAMAANRCIKFLFWCENVNTFLQAARLHQKSLSRGRAFYSFGTMLLKY